MSNIRTIGHSNHHFLDFLELLNKYNIDCIVDVRSSPYSSYTPQYNKEILSNKLKQNSITYVSFCKEFGARHDSPELLDNDGIVDFKKVQNEKFFTLGVERLKTAINKGFKLALMCSEAEPLDCHRFSMITTYLQRKEGFEIKHIVSKKGKDRIETNDELEERMLKKYKLEPSMFETEDDLLLRAYTRRNKEIGFSPYV